MSAPKPNGQWRRIFRFYLPLGATRRALLSDALAAARAGQGVFPRLMAWVLRRSVLITCHLPVQGFTFPLLPTNIIAPLVFLDRRLVDGALAEARAEEHARLEHAQRRLQAEALAGWAMVNATAWPDPARTRTATAARRRLAHVLLHEAAHHCGIVWPEWRNWVNTLARRLLFFVKWRDRRFPVFPYERIYGVGVNSADTLAARILQEADTHL
jgi:hypothetical protein